MIEYISLKGIYEQGIVRLLEVPEKHIDENMEVIIQIPVKHKKGIYIKDLIKKGNYCAVGGDAVVETEELYND